MKQARSAFPQWEYTDAERAKEQPHDANRNLAREGLGAENVPGSIHKHRPQHQERYCQDGGHRIRDK